MSEEQVKGIHPKDIEDNHLLPADEQTIERYGHEAANGVVVLTLRYDTPARFEIDGQTTNYSNYIADRVKWDATAPVARIIISFKVKADGTIAITTYWRRQTNACCAASRRLWPRLHAGGPHSKMAKVSRPPTC